MTEALNFRSLIASLKASYITINQGTQEVFGMAVAAISNLDINSYGQDTDISLNQLSMTGSDGGSAFPDGQFEVDAEFTVAATQTGVYTISAGATATVEFWDGLAWIAKGYSSASATYSGPICSGPAITGVEIYPSGSAQPQPNNGLMVGTSGTLQIAASCLDNSVQLLVSRGVSESWC